jgi:hypothetical protein
MLASLQTVRINVGDNKKEKGTQGNEKHEGATSLMCTTIANKASVIIQIDEVFECH